MTRCRLLVALAAAIPACLAFAGSAAAAPGEVTIAGTSGDDEIAIVATSAASGSYSVNGGAAQIFAGATKIVVDGGDGSDDVVIDNPTGGLLAPPLGIEVNGGSGFNWVTSRNGVAATGQYTEPSGSAPGQLVQNGAGQQVITLNGVTSVYDYNSDEAFTFRGTPAHDDLTLDEYPGPFPPEAPKQWIYGGAQSFVFNGKTSLKLDTMGTDGAPDALRLTGRRVSTADLAVDDGSQPAEDVVTANDFRASSIPDGFNLRIHAARLEGVSGPNNRDITFGTVAFDGGSAGAAAGSSSPELRIHANALDVQASGDALFQNVNYGPLQLGGVGAPVGGGVRSTGGAVEVHNDFSGRMTLAPGAVASGTSVDLGAVTLDISSGRVSASGSGGVILQPTFRDPFASTGTPIDLGRTDDDTGFNISAAELRNVSASTIRIGRADAGAVTVSDAMRAPAGSALNLVGAEGFGATGSGSLDAGSVSFSDGASSGRAWSIAPGGVATDGRQAIPYGSATAVQVAGGAGADSFAVAPSTIATYSVAGGDPTSAPGDSLTYDAGGRKVTSRPATPDGRIRAAGVRPVDFTGIESLTIANGR